MSANSWPVAHVERLKSLWTDGKSASQIARALHADLGVGYSRNAVIGKVHRLGLEGRAAPAAPRLVTFRAPSAPRSKPPRVTIPSGVGAFVLPAMTGGSGIEKRMAAVTANEAAKLTPPPGAYQPKRDAFAALPGSSPRPWTQRPFGRCAWPVGGEGADTLSCCEKTEDGGQYCGAHLKLGTSANPGKKAHELARSLRRYA